MKKRIIPHMPRLVSLGLVLLFLIGISLDHLAAEEGVMDLSSEDLSGIHRLAGEWLFTDSLGNRSTITVPGSWNEIYGTFKGSGIYSIRIILPDGLDGDLALYLPKYNQVVTIKTKGGVLYEPDKSEVNYRGFKNEVIPLNEAGNITLTVEMENFFYRRGGMHHTPYLGTLDSISRFRDRHLLVQTLIVGVFFFIFLFCLFLYFSNYAARTSISLGLASLAFAIRGMVTGEIPVEILFPSLPWSIPYRFDYTMLYLGAMFISHFVFYSFSQNEKVQRHVARILEVGGLIGALFSLTLPLHLVSMGIWAVQVYSVFVFVNCLALLFRMAVKHDSEARIIFLGGAIFFLFGILDILNTHGDQIMSNAAQKGMFFFILILFIVLARRLGETYLKAEKLSRDLEQEVARKTRELTRLSRTDPLTGIGNRRRFLELGEREVAIHHRYGHPLSLLMFDLDHFKKINDEFGHSSGDKALVHMTVVTKQFIRETDIFGRLGGEEFALILLETPLADAGMIAQRIRKELEASSGKEENELPPMTVSIGAVSLAQGESLAEVLERADALMYEAKKTGRNRVVSEED